MTLKIVQEVTVWKGVNYRQPNHVYLMLGDRAYAYSKWGEGPAEYFRNPTRLDRRGRKFIEIKKNPWHFDLSTKSDLDQEESRPAGETWEVVGSKGDRYTVSREAGRWSCTCAGHGFRGRCRHVDELSASVQLQV